MDSPQIALEVAAAMDEQQISYMLVGSFSSNVYGVPRSTRDADFVIQHPGLSFKRLKIAAAALAMIARLMLALPRTANPIRAIASRMD